MHRRIVVPSRVNIIGEHTDYAGGLALPFATEKFLELTIKSRDCGCQGDQTVVKLWQAVSDLPVELTIESNIPIGKGMSSSAALCLAIVIGAKPNLSKLETCKEAQRIEHLVLETECGLLDQIAMMFAQKNYFSLIDFSNLKIEHVKIPDEWIFKLVDSKVHRKLSNTNYNQISDYSKKHVTEENSRVRRALSSSKSQLGLLLNESHRSLQKLGVSNVEVDDLVEQLQHTEGVHGARMMGGGFGGMVLTLVENEKILPDYEVVTSSGPPLFEELS